MKTPRATPKSSLIRSSLLSPDPTPRLCKNYSKEAPQQHKSSDVFPPLNPMFYLPTTTNPRSIYSPNYLAARNILNAPWGQNGIIRPNVADNVMHHPPSNVLFLANSLEQCSYFSAILFLPLNGSEHNIKRKIKAIHALVIRIPYASNPMSPGFCHS